jgi:hypothetical protein
MHIKRHEFAQQESEVMGDIRWIAMVVTLKQVQPT